ncbi:hypothetical protein IQ227_02235 [Anabaena aphanizomenioides LEGE 00250]|uniref:Chromosome partition protein Smc n=1 Tax=Sphaerospermopsis aphanizomenoides LEGE 00250 TaxID=2777972 RepID=A0ABR9V8T1_9CYAN|nr:hypothetical protein [Sphaerospermopsis aphanizomenoides]MBE9234888.1 hypothetical protein [Sphaerospermopsis aphanizomenoides LEGE 00250]
MTVSDSSGLTEELQKQIAQKDAVIKKLEAEKSEILENFNILSENFDELTEDFNELTDNFHELTRNFNQKEYQLEVVTREKDDLYNRVKELEADVKVLEEEKYLLIQKLRDKESKLSELQQHISFLNDQLKDTKSKIIELEERINKKDTRIDELLKVVKNPPNISLSDYNITREESQITIIDQKNIYLISPLEELEEYLEELEQDLEYLEKYAKDLEKYADDLEQYAEDLEQYYLEELETYSDTININDVELTLDNFTDIDILMIEFLEELMTMNIKFILMSYLLRNIRT